MDERALSIAVGAESVSGLMLRPDDANALLGSRMGRVRG